MRCVFSKKGCKRTSKLNIERDLICPNSIHNHPIQAYNSEIYGLMNNCKKMARSSQKCLRKISMMRLDLTLLLVKYLQRMWIRNVPREEKVTTYSSTHAVEFSEMLLGSEFPTHHKFTISVGNELRLYSTLNS